MRRIQRSPLPKAAQTYLIRLQARAYSRLSLGTLNIETIWNGARQTKSMQSVLSTLQSMMGSRQRCMYCMDSHGCDIEHFWPKGDYPKRMFRWRNFLLCCTECGRIKGTQFPMYGRRPLLIDPTKEEPWAHLDFDPITGNITARFDLHAGAFSVKGLNTVRALHLDRREALAAGYVHTYRKLRSAVDRFLQGHIQTADQLIAELLHEDGHGLIGWCFKGTGQNEEPFSQLRNLHPPVWQTCCASFQYR